jgi:hypothetical protein
MNGCREGPQDELASSSAESSSGSYEGASWQQTAGSTVFAPMPAEAPHFPRPEQQWSINFRVRDLDAMVARLRAAGITVEVRAEDDPNGRFAGFADPCSAAAGSIRVAAGEARVKGSGRA